MSTSIGTDVADLAGSPELPKTVSGIKGLDEITGGGLPTGRVTLVTGAAGTGKTVLGAAFLAAGAVEYGEPGVLLTFEEPEAKVAVNVRSLGFDFGHLQRDGLLAVRSFQVDPGEIVTTGAFDLEPLFQALGQEIQRVGAKRVVLDGIHTLFGALGNDAIVRSEIIRLARWLEGQGVTSIVTTEVGERAVTRYGVEEYVCDCVITLDQQLRDEIATRHLRIVKYRGSAHGTNAYPFLISARHVTLLPITSVALDYAASDVRISAGVDRLDRMLGGGLFQGSTTLVSGTTGTGKTSLGAHVLNAACERGERALWMLLDESPEQVLRNMRSLGLDLRPHVDAGLLHMWAVRPSAFGLEAHLATLVRLVDDVAPSVVVLDGVAGFAHGVPSSEVTSMVSRQLDFLKARGITTVAMAMTAGEETSIVNVSSLVDTWILLRAVETGGERNRLLFVLKSRGSAHSNQVREFLLTDHGIELKDVYVGAQGVLTGSARLSQQAAERAAEAQAAADRDRRRRELRRSISEHELRLTAVQEELEADREEIERIDRAERQRTVAAEADRRAMASQRWADRNQEDGG